MLDILTVLQPDRLVFVIKILLLVLIFIYIIFTFIVINRIKALNRTVYIAAQKASSSLQVVSIIVFFLAISLFVATLVIV